MAVDVTPVFEAYFAHNRGPVPDDPEARQPPNYGVSARFDGAVIDLTLTFRAGSAYCCGEWGCHLDLYSGRRWDGVRQLLSARELEVPARLQLRLKVVIEAGALFFVPRRSPRTPVALAPAKAYQYRVRVTEARNPDAEPAPDT